MQSVSPGAPLIKLGPFPSRSTIWQSKPTVWDEKGRTQIAQIFVSYDKNINSIAFQYVEDDKLVMSPTFGSQNFDGPNFVAITFNDATNKEYITRVSGSHEQGNTTEQGLTTLKIETNAGSYGPFGNLGPNDTKFDLKFGPANQFGGFHGSSFPGFVRSIGVYVKPIRNLSTLAIRTELPVE